jgi:hypothetical protein
MIKNAIAAAALSFLLAAVPFFSAAQPFLSEHVLFFYIAS